MAVYLLTINPERRIMFRWKCISTAEARRLQMRIAKAFIHCIGRISIHDSPKDEAMFPPGTYDKTMNFTYTTHPRYYVGRKMI